MIKIVLDAGHGPDTPGKRTPKFNDGTFMHEHEFNNSVVHKLKDKLNGTGKFSVTIVSSSTKDVPLADRVALERQIKADLFLSVHANALKSTWGNPKGIESFWNKGSSKGEAYCKIIQDGLIRETGLYNRKAKSAPGPYYANSLYVLKNTYGPAVLVECGFMDNKEEARLLMSEEYREKVSISLFKSICSIFDVVVKEIKGYKIKNAPTANVEQMKQWAKDRNASQLFIDTADIFYNVAVREGCDPVVVYAQSAKETNFFKFGGVIDATYHNTCGLKISSGGGNYDPSAHKKFKDWEEGITAHVHHLLLYAGAEGYPLTNTPDPRHFSCILGDAPTVEMLSGKWAPSKTYGESIVDQYINGILGTEVEIIDYKALYEEAQAKLDKIKEIL